MHATQAFQQLFVALAMLSVAQASWFHKSRFDLRALAIRQTGGEGGSPAQKAGGQGTPTNDSSSSTPTPSTTPVVVGVTSKPASASSSKSPPSSESPTGSPTTTSPSTTTTTSQTSDSAQKNTDTTDETTRPTSTGSVVSSGTPVVTTKVEVVTATRSDGSQETRTSTTVSTSTPGLSSGNDETSGMSPKTRNTVIGVVVGVGGAVVLSALALVGWRIWGRKKLNEENDGLMDYDMSGKGPEKSERGSSAGNAQRTPFQSTLENYHQPGQVNASANF